MRSSPFTIIAAYALTVVGAIATVELVARGWVRVDARRPYRNHVRHVLYGVAVGLNLFAAQHNAALLGGVV